MEWNVIRYNVNTDQIEVWNIFEHATFKQDFKKLADKCSSREEFAEKVRKELQYYFWSRSEYEVIVSPWVGSRGGADKKIDIYWQVMMNFDRFIDYVLEQFGGDVADA